MNDIGASYGEMFGLVVGCGVCVMLVPERIHKT